jgi:hypothetical protein
MRVNLFFALLYGFLTIMTAGAGGRLTLIPDLVIFVPFCFLFSGLFLLFSLRCVQDDGRSKS